MPDEIVRLASDGSASGELYTVILTDPCPDCDAAAGEHCIRTNEGTRYETRAAHVARIVAAAAKRTAAQDV
jgi:hypothetical protein